MRLQQYLAHAGVASRRRSEELIVAGRISVNGCIVRELGTQIEPGVDAVAFDGKAISPEKKVYFRFYKPAHVVCSSADPEGRETVQQYFRTMTERVYNVGRLDYDSEGILLMSNDGDLSHALMHPSHEVKKTYFVICRGHLDEQEISLLRKGVEIDGRKTAPADVKILEQMRSTTRLMITIHEGRNRQVRKMFDSIGHSVSFLRREQFANLTLEGLRPSQWKELSAEELAELKRIAYAKKPREKTKAKVAAGQKSNEKKSPKNDFRPRTGSGTRNRKK